MRFKQFLKLSDYDNIIPLVLASLVAKTVKK